MGGGSMTKLSNPTQICFLLYYKLYNIATHVTPTSSLPPSLLPSPPPPQDHCNKLFQNLMNMKMFMNR